MQRICEVCKKTFETRNKTKRCSRDCVKKQAADGLAARFWSKVDIRGENECWPWMAFKNRKGYGQINIGNRPHTASRVAYELTYGPIPPGVGINHHCDNTSCVNPSHLYAGTQKQNMEDRIKRLRGNTVLTPEDVRFIRESTATASSLVERFKCDASTIRLARRGVTWSKINA